MRAARGQLVQAHLRVERCACIRIYFLMTIFPGEPWLHITLLFSFSACSRRELVII